MALAQVLAAISKSPRGPKVAAVFDFDGTLIDGYSGLVAAQHRVRSREMGASEALDTLVKGIGMRLGRVEYADALAVLARAWRGRSEDELLEWGNQLFRDDIAWRVYPEARELVAAHQRRGHTVVIATSATRYQVAPLAADLGIKDVLSTRLATARGVLTGEVARPDLWGVGKAEAVEKFAAQRGIDLHRSSAYSDGDEDVELLDRVGWPCAVNPKKALAATAEDRAWPVLHFQSRGSRGLQTRVRNVAGIGGLVAGMGAGLGIGLVNRRKRDATNFGIAAGSDLMLGLLGIRVNLIGGEHLFSHRPAVFILNHQSMLDGPVVMSLVRHDFTGVGKAEIARNPLGKAFASFTDVVLIDRGDTAAAVASLGPLVDQAKGKGLSIIIAPEGTRSLTAQVGPFKKGAFRMAMGAEMPIVPIVLRNTHELAPRGGGPWRSGVVDVVVHPPISVANWTVPGLAKRIAEVRKLYLDTLADWPQR